MRILNMIALVLQCFSINWHSNSMKNDSLSFYGHYIHIGSSHPSFLLPKTMTHLNTMKCNVIFRPDLIIVYVCHHSAVCRLITRSASVPLCLWAKEHDWSTELLQRQLHWPGHDRHHGGCDDPEQHGRFKQNGLQPCEFTFLYYLLCLSFILHFWQWQYVGERCDCHTRWAAALVHFLQPMMNILVQMFHFLSKYGPMSLFLSGTLCGSNSRKQNVQYM